MGILCVFLFCVVCFKTEGQKRHRFGQGEEIWEDLGGVEVGERYDQNILYKKF